ncbi:MAG: MoaD/ThiS family protein [Candidatus Wallbacteria bacterium]|nr:MoaD/ThiS family protein [Candidatus Wallbacteria bacterium]
MKVHIPGPLRSYTSGAARVEIPGETVAAVLAELDRRYPGMRFRIIDEQDRVRTHIKVFVNADSIEDLSRVLAGGDELTIICALSGG